MAHVDYFFDDIDEQVISEILKNEELMKELGPRNPNWFDDLNEKAEKELLAKKSSEKATIQSKQPVVHEIKCHSTPIKTSHIQCEKIESPPSFSITQALATEEKNRTKFLYPCQSSTIQTNEIVPQTPAGVSDFTGKVPGVHASTPLLASAVTPNKSSEILHSHTMDATMAAVECQTPSVPHLKVSDHPMAVSGNRSPVLRKCRGATRRKTRSCNLNRSITTPKLSQHVDDSKSTPVTMRTLAKKRPSTPHVDEYNPWKKKQEVSSTRKSSVVSPAVKLHTVNSDTKAETSKRIPTTELQSDKNILARPSGLTSTIAKKISFESFNQQLGSEETAVYDDIQNSLQVEQMSEKQDVESVQAIGINLTLFNNTCVGFQTASKKPVQVSAASWKRAESFIANLDKPNSTIPTSKHATERGVTVSKDAWKKACSIIINNSEPVSTIKCDKSSSSVPCSNQGAANMTAKKCNSTLTTGVLTCMPVPSSEDAKNTVFPHSAHRTSASQAVKSCTTGFTTASKKPLLVSSDSLNRAKNLVDENDPVKFSGFNTASSKPLNISKQAWKRVQHLFEDQSEDGGNEKLPTTPTNGTPNLAPVRCLNEIVNAQQSLSTPRVSNLKNGTCSERRPVGSFSSCPKAKRRNSSYKPPRRKISLDSSSVTRQNAVSFTGLDASSNKENHEQHLSYGGHSAKRKLGLKQKQEDQINISDESLLMAMELFESV